MQYARLVVRFSYPVIDRMCKTNSILVVSVLDPNKLNLDLDQDPEFWLNLDPVPGLFDQFLKNNLNNFREKLF